MALRSEKAACIVALAVLPLAAQEFRYEVRHDHLVKSGRGVLVFDDAGVAYSEAKHKFQWPWREIQRLELAPRQVRVLTYQDSRWRLGKDREFRFELVDRGGADFSQVYAHLRDRLDQRLVAALPDEAVAPLFEIPAKRLGTVAGSQGTLLFGADRIVFRTPRRNESRTWRYRDIDNLSTTGPFELTLTTYEGIFRFQLKERLEEARYNDLWSKIFLR